ncbi:MAG: ankyrin repeat domain-containing protein [Sterolibacteriaceae bacterium]|nr:ankyrin repeat domain-containing protein [Candidatus Methylophosphatis haderslevensis]
MKKYYPPTDFFAGRELELARAIDREDQTEIRVLARGVDLNAKARQDMTLLIYAVMNDKFASISELVRLGARPDENIIDGIGSVIDHAMYSKDLRYLTALLDGGLSVDFQDSDRTPLIQRAAGAGGSIEHVKLLVSRGANVNRRDSIGGTALHSAINVNHVEVGLYLVQIGADIAAHKSNGASVSWAVQLSIDGQQPGPLRTKFEQLRDLMIQKGAKFPADPPEVVRDRMRTQGLKPAVPPGKAK